MRRVAAVLILLVVVFVVPIISAAQSAPPGPSVTVPRLIQITGVFQPVDGQPASAVEIVTLSVYAEADGGLPVWQERQTVAIEKTTGRFTLLLGASDAAGIPAEVFASGAAQWMSLLFERAGEREQARVRIASVPYALKASDAETLGGLPASAYVRAPTAAEGGSRETSTVTATEAPTSVADVLPGTTNFLAKYVNGADVGNSAVYEIPTATVPTGAVGIGTTTPLDQLHLRFNNTNGAITGLAVQNLGNTAASYSGTLFYDQFGALAQFQGFNNVTHEYRINNIATNASINLMTASTSRLFVAPTGNVGIGTNTPGSKLDVNGSANVNGHVNIAGFLDLGALGTNPNVRLSVGGPSAGTSIETAPVMQLSRPAQSGIKNTNSVGFSVGAFEEGILGRTRLDIKLSGLPTDSNTYGTIPDVTVMTMQADGNVGIGTATPGALLEVVRRSVEDPAPAANIYATGFDESVGQFQARKARVSLGIPSAVHTGDALGRFEMAGYSSTGFSRGQAGMIGFASENWSGSGRGARLWLYVTPEGSNAGHAAVMIDSNRNVSIGNAFDLPATDRLQVFGDIRVGSFGTNGCLKNFAGTGLVGTCASDRRFKKDITPFSPILSQLAALQPVYYFWRAEDFPQQHFGDSRAYGLIAQDVEDVLPELVVTGEDGFKAVDYTKLPLLTIQAVKELKTENDALRAGQQALQQRVGQLERLVSEMLATTPPR